MIINNGRYLVPHNSKIIYRPGIEMKIPDYLSRTQPTQSEEIELDLIMHTVNIAQKQADLQEATEDDEELKMVKQLIINGWPEDVKHIPKLIKSYWSLKECSSVQDGLVTKSECKVIPKSM